MISGSLWKGLTAVAAIIAAAWAIDARYQLAASAETQYQLLAAEQEIGKLETELKLIDLELKTIRATKEIRALSEEEAAREEYLKQRRAIIEERLLETTKAA